MNKLKKALNHLDERGGTPPEARLLIAVVQQALDEKDSGYFLSETFERHAELLGLKRDIIILHLAEIFNDEDE